MKPKLLVLTPRLPFPPIGGDRLRIYQLCKYLSSDFDLSLLSLCESSREMTLEIPPSSPFSSVERVFHPFSRKLLGVLSALPSNIPLQVGFFRNPQFANRVKELASSHDAVLSHLIRTAEYLEKCDLPRVLEMTDAISLSYERTAAHLGSLRGALYRMEAGRLIRFERELINRCDLTILVSAVDRDFLVQDVKSDKSMVCSNGVESDRFRFDYAPDGQTIVFIGKNFAFYNVDAILYFAEVVLPLVRSQFPQTRFKVIGQIGDGLRRRLEKQGVAVTGGVDDIGAAAHGATIGVCPLRVGAGVQNKILEYMSLGIPVVTSKVGLEGLDATPDQHLLVANQPAEWASQIVRLLSTPDLRKDLAYRGRTFVEEKHAWAALVGPVNERILDLIGRTRTRSADVPADQGTSLS